MWVSIFMQLFCSTHLSQKKIVKIGCYFYEKENTVCSTTKKLIENYISSKKSMLSNKQKYFYMYYLIFFRLIFTLTGRPLLDFINFFSIGSIHYFDSKYADYSKEILEKVTYNTFESNFSKIEKRLDLLNQQSEKFLQQLLDSEKEGDFAIYIQITKDFSASYIIKNKLKALFNNNTIRITAKYNEANLIITDCLDYSKKNTTIFFLDSASASTTWTRLIRLIQQEYVKRFY